MSRPAPWPSSVGLLKLEIVRAARRLLDLQLVIGTTGNVSARAGDVIWITPTRTPYETMRPEQLTPVDAVGGRNLGTGRPSGELPLHLEAYGARSDIGAVVHTHSPYATAWSYLDRQLEPETDDLAYYQVGRVFTAPVAPAGSEELARGAAMRLRHANAVLLAGHGVVTVADTVDLAVVRAQIVEHVARVAWLVLAANGRQ
jgi:L-fuculose-phosphate aldolase